MRDTKWLSIITGGVSVIAFCCVFFFHENIGLKLIYDISLAIFGSALLGFIMSLIQYFAAKRKSMEIFYSEALKAINILGKAKYFFTDEPIDLIANCIAEEQYNKWNTEFKQVPKHTSKNKLIEYKSKMNPADANDPTFKEYCEIWYTDKMNAYYQDLKECFNSYIKIADMKLGTLDNAYGNLDFIFGNRSLRQWTYEAAYKPIKEIWRSAVEQAYHFQLYKVGKGNRAVCTTLLLGLNKEWFSTKEINDKDIHSIVIYRKHYDILSDTIEKFRCKIYKQQFTQEDHSPIISKIYYINDENE